MKKVGILTWYFGANYGAKAQAYALQQTIKGFGYETFMINYKPRCYKKLNIQTNTEFDNKLFHPIRLAQGISRCKKFDQANMLFNETVSVSSYDDINALGFDCIVLGSDAIFNIMHPLFDKIYYGVGIKTNKILYSPSCEYLPTSYKLDVDLKASLNEMKALSVRDINTQTLIHLNTGIKPVMTLDPTFLYSFNDIETEFLRNDYILIYSFGDLSEYKEQIISFSNERKLPIVSIGRYYKWADKSYCDATFAEWISSFRNASYVLTDSFHGTVFSIKNSKELIICSKSDKKAKIESLLKVLGINREFYSGKESINEYLTTKIDYSIVESILEDIIEGSKEYLVNSLEASTVGGES